MFLHDKSERLLNRGISLKGIQEMKVRESIARARYVGESSMEKMGEIGARN